ncbi:MULTISPECIES: helix-turn-helix domain-containing protein [Sphingomonas]|uniref:XRE family transcriptional regulator n=1 Tax=Sphingomonas adhaesiva TaxID=28212 RepID=A0A2A4IDM5_9SPHN|nr:MULTISPECIES: helix-turn-helix transcriptional regulator [Sphingomonas]PCG15923.1 XRE family transcriptional regulator [Sphingomonas adhaesiva]PZU80743.1 MAG: XRE family transcriptional regulator [Sphingomonas sp.]
MAKSLFTPDARQLARLLAQARRDAGITQVELARTLGKPQPFVSLIERGERRVDVVEFCEIARAIGWRPLDLFDRFLECREQPEPAEG